jgi:hypothetical protein
VEEEGKMVGLYNVKRYPKKNLNVHAGSQAAKKIYKNVTIIPNKHCKVGFKQE